MKNINNQHYYQFIVSFETTFLLSNETFESVNQSVYSQNSTTFEIQNKEIKGSSSFSEKVSISFLKRRKYKYFEFHGC